MRWARASRSDAWASWPSPCRSPLTWGRANLSGRLGRAEVDAVLSAAGEASRPPQMASPAGLTERDVDVLRLLARGRTNKHAASELGVAAKTVGHHVESIYAKAGVTTRATGHSISAHTLAHNVDH